MAIADKDFIVAIELGSSRITGVAGKKTNDGGAQVLAYASSKTDTCIRRGVVSNLMKTTQIIKDIIRNLESQLKMEIKKTYVGVGGQSLRSYVSYEKRNMLTQSTINEQIIDAMRDDSCHLPFSGYETLENIPQEYRVDSNVVIDPVGVLGTSVEGKYLNIIARETLRSNISNCVANAGLELVESPISVCQLGKHLVMDVEKNSGCALVDFGAETTTVVVYKKNLIRHLAVIPLGSNNITKDLASLLQLDEEEAENVKLKYGNAYPENGKDNAEGNNAPASFTTSDGRTFDITEVQRIVDARVQEIIANVRNQINKSGYSESLLSGIILTGGGSNIRNIVKSIQEITKFDKVRLARSLKTPVTKVSGISMQMDSGMNNTVLSLMLEGDTPCGGDTIEDSLFNIQEKQPKTPEVNPEKEALDKLVATFDKIRQKSQNAKILAEELKNNLSDKRRYNSAMNLYNEMNLPDEFQDCLEMLRGKDKYKVNVKEAEDLENIFEDAREDLEKVIKEYKKQNSLFGKFRKTLEDIINDE